MPIHRVMTGYRPTGKLHLGHWFGNLQTMITLQNNYDAFFFVADWHALTSEWQNPSHVREFGNEMVLDWLAAGLDPERCTIYRQSDIPEVIELMLYFNMLLPMSWLERVPSYKEQQQNIKNKDLSNVGFFLYPSLMAADIAVIKADQVPVGEDQLPHLELAREVVRRFNSMYGETLVEPQSLIAKEGARVPGLDGRKMSKSYGNSIYISDTPDELRKKAMECMTDPARKLKSDPGDPDICPLHQIYKLIVDDPDNIIEWESCCRNASCGCVAHKKEFGEALVTYLEDFRTRRAELAAHPSHVEDVLRAGKEKVRPITIETIEACREHIGLDPRRGA